MQLTDSQFETFRKVEKELTARKIVLLTGGANGKTSLIHKLQSKHYPRASDSKEPLSNRLPRLHVCMPVYFGDPSRIRPQQLMKQVLLQLGISAGKEVTQVATAFICFLSALAKRRLTVAITVDNPKALSDHAIEALKYINEIRDPNTQKSIGVGVVLSGSTQIYKKLSPSFLERCSQVTVSRIPEHELAEFVEALYPGKSAELSNDVLQILGRCTTTLEIKCLLDQAFAEHDKLRLARVDSSIFTRALTSTIKTRQAA